MNSELKSAPFHLPAQPNLTPIPHIACVVSNTIAPEISLYTARITYQWNVQLESGSIHTKIDPNTAIAVTWTDKSLGGGKWVTDFRLPLTGTTASALAADIKVRRQFQF